MNVLQETIIPNPEQKGQLLEVGQSYRARSGLIRGQVPERRTAEGAL
ncbi:hypothetical protein BEI_3785 [Halomonas beimenensis]|uniref:Uncharacterized protein n=1 Tax=Halomonas beimenensis TaxID=475662 RepID=A0A291PD24_9GAMM|nr:hypothetical protein BEI_3785 [Halomonas beimenensis]